MIHFMQEEIERLLLIHVRSNDTARVGIVIGSEQIARCKVPRNMPRVAKWLTTSMKKETGG